MMVMYMDGFSPTTYWIVVMEVLHVQMVGASTEAHLALVVASVKTVLHDHLALGYIDG